MTRIKITALASLAVFALSVAVATASASAEQWFVNHSTTFGSEALGEATNVKTPFTLTFQKEHVKISCTTVTDQGGKITEGSGGQAASLTFTGCTVAEPSTKCKVESEITEIKETKKGIKEKKKKVKGEIKTVAVTATLIAGTKIEFKPSSGSIFTTFILAKCAGAEGEFNVNGQATGNATKPEEAEKSLTFLGGSASGSELKVGDEEASFAGAVGLKLASGKIFGAE